MQGKRNPHTLLVGIEARTTTMENNMEASLKTKIKSAMFQHYHSWSLPE
jgi:uncharacterized FAD-dependent dehydrogenase